MENIKKFEPVGIVEQFAAFVVGKVREKTGQTLGKRVYRRTYEESLAIAVQEAIEEIPKTVGKRVKNAVLQLVQTAVIIPENRSKYRQQINSLMKKYHFSLDMNTLQERTEELFLEAEWTIKDPRNNLGFLEIIDKLWDTYKETNIQIFGNHQIYKIAMIGYEHAHKRHLPRKTEIRYEKRIRNR